MIAAGMGGTRTSGSRSRPSLIGAACFFFGMMIAVDHVARPLW